MRLLSITLARITTVRFCVNGTGEAMRTSPYLPFAKSIVPLALSILLVTASPPRGRYWYNVDTPDLEPLHSILISRHPVWGWLYGAGCMGLVVAMACVTWRGPLILQLHLLFGVYVWEHHPTPHTADSGVFPRQIRTECVREV